MKPVNREPTAEMIEAALGSNGSWPDIWQAMYDAAPEIKLDMEPVAFIDSDIGWRHQNAVYSA